MRYGKVAEACIPVRAECDSPVAGINTTQSVGPHQRILPQLETTLISQREIRMPRSGHETALNDRVVRAGPTSEGREHGEGHSTVAKYLWLEMLSQHTVGAKGAALGRGAGTKSARDATPLAVWLLPVGREGGRKLWRGLSDSALRARRREQSTRAHGASVRAMRIGSKKRILSGEIR